MTNGLPSLDVYKKMSQGELEHLSVLTDLSSIYSAKNSDYGNSARNTYDEFGFITYIIRLKDKLNRLVSLNKKGEPSVDESIEDTLMDMANYCIMAVMDIRRNEN